MCPHKYAHRSLLTQVRLSKPEESPRLIKEQQFNASSNRSRVQQNHSPTSWMRIRLSRASRRSPSPSRPCQDTHHVASQKKFSKDFKSSDEGFQVTVETVENAVAHWAHTGFISRGSEKSTFIKLIAGISTNVKLRSTSTKSSSSWISATWTSSTASSSSSATRSSSTSEAANTATASAQKKNAKKSKSKRLGRGCSSTSGNQRQSSSNQSGPHQCTSSGSSVRRRVALSSHSSGMVSRGLQLKYINQNRTFIFIMESQLPIKTQHGNFPS